MLVATLGGVRLFPGQAVALQDLAVAAVAAQAVQLGVYFHPNSPRQPLPAGAFERGECGAFLPQARQKNSQRVVRL